MATPLAIRYIAAGKSAVAKIYLQCHVKPGASKQREGILSITESEIEICVSAQARENEANKAVRELFSSVLKCPKTDIEIVRGLKSRDKTVALTGLDGEGDVNVVIANIKEQMEASIE